MGVAYAKCGDAFYTWDLYTGVRYMQSGTLCNGKIAYMENIVVVADRTQLLSGTAHPNALRAQRAAEAAGRER